MATTQATTLDGANTAPPEQLAAAETLADVLTEMRQHLRLLNAPRPPRRLVDITASEASATSLTLRRAQSALTLLDTIVYSVSAAAIITIGSRAIPVPLGAGSLRVGQMVLYPADTVSLALSGGSPVAGPQYLEIIGWQIAPSEHFEVVR